MTDRRDRARDRARELARKAHAAGEPTRWFETLYSGAGRDADHIPWANLAPNPQLLAWCDRAQVPHPQSRTLVVGCGLGDDAELLARRGAQVTAFDLSSSAIAWCRERFPGSTVDYRVADLLSTPEEWREAFDLVVEIYTLQALPLEIRAAAMPQVASFVARGGRLLVIARARDEHEPLAELPWPLTRRELEQFAGLGLRVLGIEDLLDDEQPPVRRFRACYERPGTDPAEG